MSVKKSLLIFFCIFMLFFGLAAVSAVSDDDMDSTLENMISPDDSISGNDGEILEAEDSQSIAGIAEGDDLLNQQSEDILANQTLDEVKGSADISISQSGKYYGDKTLTVKVVDSKGKLPVSNHKVSVKFSNGKSVTLTTDSNGRATYALPFKVGTYSAAATLIGDDFNQAKAALKNIKIVKAPAKLSISNAKTTYDSGKMLNIKVINSKTKKAIPNVKINLKVYTGSKYKKVKLTTDKNGIAKYSYSKLKIGKHKIVIVNGDKKNMAMKSKSKTVKISKAKVTIAYSKKTLNYKKDSLSITVKNSASGKIIKGLKIKVKVKNNGKFKTYNLKTDSKGVVKLNTKGLSLGKHSISITSANKKYKVAKSTSVTVVKNQAKFVMSDFTTNRNDNFTFTLKDSNGKALANKKVSVTVTDSSNKVLKYTVTTDGNGKGTLPLANLDVGKYTFKCLLTNDKDYPDASASCKATIKKKSTIAYIGLVHVYPRGTMDIDEYTQFKIYIKDADTGEEIDGMISIEERTYYLGEPTNNNGKISYPYIYNPQSVSSGTTLKLYAPNNKRYTLHVSFAGNDMYTGISGTIKV